MHQTDGWVGGFHIQAAPVSKSSRALAPTAPQSPVTLNLAPFTITRQKLENSHNVYLPSLCIAFIALDKKRTTTRQENEEAEKNITKHTRNQDQHHHHHHHPGRVKEMIVLL